MSFFVKVVIKNNIESKTPPRVAHTRDNIILSMTVFCFVSVVIDLLSQKL
jgi:hypothetical protein